MNVKYYVIWLPHCKFDLATRCQTLIWMNSFMIGSQGFVLLDIELAKANCKGYKLRILHTKNKTPIKI